jgi:hypothetical protein
MTTPIPTAAQHDHAARDARRAAAEAEAAGRHASGARLVGRRAFLTGAGALVMPLPFLEIFAGRAHAAPAAPRHYLAWHQGQGTQWNEWVVPGAGETDFRLGRILEPVAAFKDRFLFLRGVDNKVKSLASGNGHDTSQTTCMTCQPNGAGPSFDQVLAQRIRKPGQRLSLNLGVGRSARIRFYAGAGDRIESQGDPRKVLASVFVGGAQSGAELARLQARRRSILDAVRANMTSFRARLGRDDRARLDQHADKLRELETRYMQQAATATTCGSPQLKLPATFNPALDHAASAEAQIEILAMAFACNLTPVGTIEFTDDHNPAVLSSFAQGYSDWHDMVHQGESRRNIAGLISGYRWYAERFAKLLERFAAVQVEGGSLLDHTCIQWTCDFGYGAGHNGLCVQAALVGSLGPQVKMGRLLSFVDPEKLWSSSPWSLNNLYATILRAFGQSDDTFGRAVTGARPGAIAGV